jgi:hypothetical protein
MYFWFPLLAGLSELTFDPRSEIRCDCCLLGRLAYLHSLSGRAAQRSMAPANALNALLCCSCTACRAFQQLELVWV